MIEADFQRFYGVDLGAACFGRRPWSARRLLALLRHLPPDAALHAHHRRGWWTQRDELAAATVELASATVRCLAALGGARSLPDVISIPRPVDEPVDEFVTRDPMVAFRRLRAA